MSRKCCCVSVGVNGVDACHVELQASLLSALGAAVILTAYCSSCSSSSISGISIWLDLTVGLALSSGKLVSNFILTSCRLHRVTTGKYAVVTAASFYITGQ